MVCLFASQPASQTAALAGRQAGSLLAWLPANYPSFAAVPWPPANPGVKFLFGVRIPYPIWRAGGLRRRRRQGPP